MRRLLAELPRSTRVLVGPGDDAAVLPGSPGPWAVTTDTLVEGVDFFPDLPPEAIGRRAMAVNLSDLAAMGAHPEVFLLTVAFPPARGEDFPLAVARGALSRATPLGVSLAGGDLSRAPVVFVSIALWGRLEREPLSRSGARAGDLLYISGSPGRAAAGLRLSAEGGRASDRPDELPDSARAELVAAYRDPEPRVELGLLLAREGWARAAIDVSDGLGIDAGRLAAASGVKVVLEAERLPISAALAAFGKREGLDPIELAISGGDDYELLFAVPSELAASIPPQGPGGVPLTRIGRIEPGQGALLRSADGDREIASLGHDHLRVAP